MGISTRLYNAFLTPTFILLASCEAPPSSVQAGNTLAEIRVPDDGNSICNPFGGTGGNQREQGIHGALRYLPDEVPRANGVRDFLTTGILTPYTLYLNQLNTPTRPFDQGFVTQNGTLLKTPAGDTLYEWFSLEMETLVMLGHSDAAAKYQFAILSDDGALVSIKDGGASGNYTSFINNDGTTPTRLACASHSISMGLTTQLPMKIEWFQGPRYHIALMMLWRQIPNGLTEAEETAYMADPECGRSGNDRYFDSTHSPSTPQTAWLQMLDRGWKVLGADNYWLQTGANPCDPGVPSDPEDPTDPGGLGGGVGV